MTSREIVSRAVHFRNPPRLPVMMGCLGVDDTSLVDLSPPVGRVPADGGADEWGCVWIRSDLKNMGQVKVHPLPDLRDLDAFRPPDFSYPARYTVMAAELQRLEARDQYVLAGIFMVLFERLHALYGFENTLAGLYDNRAALGKLADMIVAAHVGLVREVSRRFPGRIHGWHLSDDWGTQTASFISLELWLDFFLPRYRRIFDAIHAAGSDVWVHSCGKVHDILEGYIRAGANVVNLQQPRALGIPEIGARYRGRLAFQSLADIQATLPTGDRRRVAADAEELMAHWAAAGGGFIFSDYGNDAAIGVPDPTLKRFMYDEFSRHSQRLYGQPLPPPMTNREDAQP